MEHKKMEPMVTTVQYTITGPQFKPFSRLNMQCETGFESCPLKPFNCLLPVSHDRVRVLTGDIQKKIQLDHDNQMCMPSQLSKQVGICNQQNSTKKHKMCDGAFLWCDQGAPVASVLQKVPWLDKECSDVIAKECDLRYRCFQQCLQERQSGECNFFAIKPDHCRTFATLDGTEFSSSSCGSWKVYQMNCVDGSCDDASAIANTTASTLKTEDSTTVSGLCISRRIIPHTFIKSMLVFIMLYHEYLLGHNLPHSPCSRLMMLLKH